FEDSLSPTWDNVVTGQANLIEAVRRTLAFTSPEGKAYALNPTIATLLVRPRGWHLTEKHATFRGQPVSASLFDFGLYFFHNVRLFITYRASVAHAMGGMAPFIPSRKNTEINAAALAKVRDDKLREVNDGFDGTWVAHPDLVPTAKEVFDAALGARPHQKDRL